MKPLSSHSILEAVALMTVPVVGAFLIWALWPVRGAIKQNGDGAAAVLAKAATALDTVNDGCHDNGHQVVCGTLQQVAQSTKNIGIVAAQSAEQVKQSGKLISAAADTIAAVGDHVNGTMDALTGTAGQATTSLSTITAHTTPVLDATAAAVVTLDAQVKTNGSTLQKAVGDFDARVSSKEVDQALQGIADTSTQAALTTAQLKLIAIDARKAADAATAPAPWWKKALNYGTLGVNIACLATHSCPF
jgi:hypothetical protein